MTTEPPTKKPRSDQLSQSKTITPLHQTKVSTSTSSTISYPPPDKTKEFKIPTREIPTSTDIEIPDNELDSSNFPANGLILTEDWNPRDEHANLGTCKIFLLDNFSVLKNQTLVFKITVPSDSKRWSINLGPPEMAANATDESDQSWSTILYHFNPRYGGKKKELVQCDMTDGTWGVTDRRAFSAFSVLPTGNFQLMIQV